MYTGMRSILLVESVIIFLIHIAHMNQLYSFFLSEDELGYWGNAAFFLGKDWSSAVSSCPYYSYGYSFILMLILALPVSSLIMYRIAIILNACYMVGAFLISYRLFTRIHPGKNRYIISVACTCMAMYSAYVANSSVTWPECFLVLLTWLIFYQAYLLCEKVTMSRLCIFILELGYIYAVHQRTLAIVISGIILLLFLSIHRRLRFYHWLILLVTVPEFCLLRYIKILLKANNYFSSNGHNDYSGIISNMSLSNMGIPMIREALGQFYYMWMATFGVLILGIIVVIKYLLQSRHEKHSLWYLYFFVLLSFLGEWGISSIAMRLAIERTDQLIYGRYFEHVIGFFLIMGILEIGKFIRFKHSFLILIISNAIMGGITLLLIQKIQSWNIPIDTYYQGVCAAGTFWYVNMRGFHVLELYLIVWSIEMIIYLIFKLGSDDPAIHYAGMILLSLFWIYAGNQVVDDQIVAYQNDYNQSYISSPSLDAMREHHRTWNVVFVSGSTFNQRGGYPILS